MRKPVSGVSDQVTNLAVQSLNMARGLKFQIQKIEGLYYPCSENKGADQVTAQLICIFVFAYAKSRFSHDTAHIKNLGIMERDLNCFIEQSHQNV